MRGYFGIGIYHTRAEFNVGTLWRSANQLGASFIFTVGRRYKEQHSDTFKTPRHIPLYHYDDFEALVGHLPIGCRIIAVETDGHDLRGFDHLQQCVYLLGAEDNGLPASIAARCHTIVTIPSIKHESYNVAVAGSIIMYDRLVKYGES